MLRPAVFALALVLVLLAAACGGGEEVRAVPETVEGTVTQQQVEGDPAAGETLYTSEGCGGCHVFEAAGSQGQVGPALNQVGVGAEANQQEIADYVRSSIVNPNAYIAEGYQEGIMPSYASLEPQQVADLVAFITENQ